MDLKSLSINKSWTLFLDRDGVINEKLPNDYVKRISEFQFIEGAKDAIASFSKQFGRIVVVTNQQGIGKGLMTVDDLDHVHLYMQSEIVRSEGKLDRIYYCPELAEKNAPCRKPNTGMAEQAREDFPEIDFKKSIMVGDSISDLQMGKRVGMFTVYISDEKGQPKEADVKVESLKVLEGLI